MSDFLEDVANARLEVIAAQTQRALADISEAKASADYSGGMEAVQRIADLEAEKANLMRLHGQYRQSQAPPPQPRHDAWQEKRVEEMTPLDAFNMINATSRYGKQTAAEYNAGMADLQRRKDLGDLPGR